MKFRLRLPQLGAAARAIAIAMALLLALRFVGVHGHALTHAERAEQPCATCVALSEPFTAAIASAPVSPERAIEGPAPVPPAAPEAAGEQRAIDARGPPATQQ
jgi:hypothetical protein